MVVRVRFARTLRGTTPVANPAHRGETFQRDRDAGLRGNRSKRGDAPYKTGQRPAWVKIKNRDYSRRAAVERQGR